MIYRIRDFQRSGPSWTNSILSRYPQIVNDKILPFGNQDILFQTPPDIIRGLEFYITSIAKPSPSRFYLGVDDNDMVMAMTSPNGIVISTFITPRKIVGASRIFAIPIKTQSFAEAMEWLPVATVDAKKEPNKQVINPVEPKIKGLPFAQARFRDQSTVLFFLKTSGDKKTEFLGSFESCDVWYRQYVGETTPSFTELTSIYGRADKQYMRLTSSYFVAVCSY